MKEISLYQKRARVSTKPCLIALTFFCVVATPVHAQDRHLSIAVATGRNESVKNSPRESHQTLRSGDATIELTYAGSELTRADVTFPKLASNLEFQRVLDVIDRLKPLGYLGRDQPVFGIVMSGWTQLSVNYEHASVSRDVRSCPYDSDEVDCGTRAFVVRYWFPADGIVEGKRSEPSGVFDHVRYYLTIAGIEYSVPKEMFDTVIMGQFTRYSTTAGGAFRLDP